MINIDVISNVFSLIQWGDYSSVINQENCIARQIKGTSVFAIFTTNANQQYIQLLESIFLEYPGFEESISKKSFDALLLGFMQENHATGEKEITKELWDNFILRIKKLPEMEYKIFFPWPNWACFLKTPGTIGILTWYNKEDLIRCNHMFANALIQTMQERDFKNVEQVLCIRCRAKEQDEKSAWNIAVIYYKRLLSLFYTLLPVVLSNETPADTIAKCFTDTILLAPKKSYSNFSPPPPQPTNQVNVFPQMINMIAILCKHTRHMTWWEKRFLVAITLIGKARETQAKFEQFLLCASGLEAITKMGKKNLTFQFTHHSAYLITANKEEQDVIISDLTLMYDIRSDIAHGKHLEVSDKDLNNLFIYTILALRNYFQYVKAMRREEEYSDFINARDKKYKEIVNV